jgi:hypothetical protein
VVDEIINHLVSEIKIHGDSTICQISKAQSSLWIRKIELSLKCATSYSWNSSLALQVRKSYSNSTSNYNMISIGVSIVATPRSMIFSSGKFQRKGNKSGCHSEFPKANASGKFHIIDLFMQLVWLVPFSQRIVYLLVHMSVLPFRKFHAEKKNHQVTYENKGNKCNNRINEITWWIIWFYLYALWR